MEIIGRYIYGSGNSLDTDMVYLVDQKPDTISECKDFCTKMKKGNENLNIAMIEDGIITKCFKGTTDELNNAIYRTYGLHKQDTPLLINRIVERDVFLKVIRSVRSILSHFSKSHLRSEIKKALKGTWEDRVYALRDISLLDPCEVDFEALNPNMSGRDVMKLVAFQIGQCRGLFEGVELYTKNEIGKRYEVLKKYLNRESDDWETLSHELWLFCEKLLNDLKIVESDLVEAGTVVFRIDGDYSNCVTYDLKLEKKL